MKPEFGATWKRTGGSVTAMLIGTVSIDDYTAPDSWGTHPGTVVGHVLTAADGWVPGVNWLADQWEDFVAAWEPL